MNTKHISIAALSLSLVFGATACTNNEPNPAPTASSTNEKRAESGKFESSNEKLELTDKVSFDDNNYLVTTTEKTKFTIEGYGIVDQLPSGEKAAEGEVFHAIHYSNTHPKNANVFRPGISYIVDGQAVEDPSFSFDGGTKIISAPEDAKLSVVTTTTDGTTEEVLTQQIDFKTGKRLSAGVADAWYVPNEGTLIPNTTTAPVDPERTANITMNFASANKEVNNSKYGQAENGSAWLVLKTNGVEWEAGNNVITGETAAIWLIDENGNRFDPVEPWSDLGSSEIVFEVPAEGTEYQIHTLHSGVVSKEGATVKEINDVEMNMVSIKFKDNDTA